MTPLEDDLLPPFMRLLSDISTPSNVREAEVGLAHDLWAGLRESGFLDALVSERDGGAGLQPTNVANLLLASGRHLLPAPFAETMVARAFASRAGIQLPSTPILLWPENAHGQLRSSIPPIRAGATHALIQRHDQIRLRALAPEATPSDGYGLLAAALDENTVASAAFGLEPDTLLNWSATLAAVTMAGAMSGTLEITVNHVNTREQFGRKLGKFQAIQHELAVMAERTTTACTAALVALSRPMPGPRKLDAAAAKIAANEAAKFVCAAAHAAHGAIGITAEHDLQLYTRRIKRAAFSFGSSGYWAEEIGQNYLSDGANAGDFIRSLWSV
jgi:acyl-CoA dehydrogenase